MGGICYQVRQRFLEKHEIGASFDSGLIACNVTMWPRRCEISRHEAGASMGRRNQGGPTAPRNRAFLVKVENSSEGRSSRRKWPYNE